MCARIRAANAKARAAGVTTLASVTMNRLIGDYDRLVPFLEDLGFSAVTFSYPRSTPHGSGSLVYSETSGLVDYSREELLDAFGKVAELAKRGFPVLNPGPSRDDMARHLRGEPERIPCYGGYKYFYMDWKYDLYRCESWDERMCSVWDFETAPLVRDGCTACMTDCYRDTSVMLHFAVSLGDAAQALRRGAVRKALASVLNREAAASLGSILAQSRDPGPDGERARRAAAGSGRGRQVGVADPPDVGPRGPLAHGGRGQRRELVGVAVAGRGAGEAAAGGRVEVELGAALGQAVEHGLEPLAREGARPGEAEHAVRRGKAGAGGEAAQERGPGSQQRRGPAASGGVDRPHQPARARPGRASPWRRGGGRSGTRPSRCRGGGGSAGGR